MLGAGPEFPRGGGTAGALIRALDWSTTRLGPMSAWSNALRSTVQTLLSSRHPMFLWWGPDLVQLYNDAYIPSFGEGKHPRALGQAGRDCWGEIWSIIGPQIEAVMSSGESTFHEDALVPIARNGRIEDVYWTYGYSPVVDDDGSIGGTLVVCTETTARVLATRRQELFRRLAEKTSPLLPADDVARTICQVLESNASDVPFAILGTASGDVLAATQGAPSFAALAETAESLVVPLGTDVLAFGLSPRLRLDNDYRAFLVHLAESIEAALDRSRQYEVHAAGERERRALLLQAPIATALMTGPNHVFELANPRYVEMVGREVVGKAYLDAFPELRGTPMPDLLDRVYRTGTPYVTHELLVPLDRLGTGVPQPCYFRFNLEPIRNSAGHVFGMMAIAVEITELVVAGRAKDEFLAMLGHELRNPLSPIVTALDVIRAGEDARYTREHRIIEGQVDHLVRLVDDLLDVARITRGKVELTKAPAKLSEIVERAVQIARALIDQRRHELAVRLPDEPVVLVCDTVRIAQVLANLLTNAARYTEPGGAIALHVQRDGGELVFEVADTGIGISPEMLPRIFELFVQEHRNVERAQGGLGVGLALVRSLVALHDGTVTVRSEGRGKGSAFTVRLPLVAAPAVDPPATGPAARSRHRVLIVDDNVDAAVLLGELLRMHGHEVEVVHDPDAALELSPRFRPDVAVLDLGLPVMDGVELARRLRTQRECRMIALTGYGQGHDRERTSAAGFAAHLVKPVKFDALLAAIG